MSEEGSKNKTKTNGRDNRIAGHNFEREVVKKLKEIGIENIGTSRQHSRSRDNAKVDICRTDEIKYGRLPYNIQCKSVSKHLDYGKILDEMPKNEPEVNIIFHKQTKKADNGRFMVKGNYAILKLEDMYDMMKRLLELEDEAKSWNNLM